MFHWMPGAASGWLRGQPLASHDSCGKVAAGKGEAGEQPILTAFMTMIISIDNNNIFISQ